MTSMKIFLALFLSTSAFGANNREILLSCSQSAQPVYRVEVQQDIVTSTLSVEFFKDGTQLLKNHAVSSYLYENGDITYDGNGFTMTVSAADPTGVRGGYFDLWYNQHLYSGSLRCELL